MNVEIVGALVLLLTLVVLCVRFVTPSRRRRTPAPSSISFEDQRLLPFLSLTRGQWLALTDHQRATLREQAYRGMF